MTFEEKGAKTGGKTKLQNFKKKIAPFPGPA